MTALEKFSAILEEIQKEAAPGVPRGGRTMYPGWLGAGKPMPKTSPTRLMGAERGTIPPTKVEAMTSGLSGEKVTGLKALLAGRPKPTPAQPVIPGKFVRPGPIPQVGKVPEPKVWMNPVGSAEKRTQEALGEFVGRGAQAARKVKAAPTFATSEKVPVKLQAARFKEPTTEALAVQLGQKSAVPPISAKAIAGKRVRQALGELAGPQASKSPTLAEAATASRGASEKQMAQLEEKHKVTSAAKSEKERIRSVLTQRAFESSKAAPEALPKYDPGAVALGKKVVEKTKEVAALPGKMVAGMRERTQAQFEARRQAVRTEVAKRMSWGKLAPKARYEKPGVVPAT